MRLSNETLAILKNFAAINSNIYIRQGSTLNTVHSLKNMFATAQIKDVFPVDFGIYDLNEFLSVLSLHRDDLELSIDDVNILVSGKNGRSTIKYRTCPAHIFKRSASDTNTIFDVKIKIDESSYATSFDLSQEDFKWILDTANVLHTPNIAIKSDGNKITMECLDLQNDAAHTESLELDAKCNGDSFNFVFKTEFISKFLAGSYRIKLKADNPLIMHLQNKNFPLEYWITTETNSFYKKADSDSYEDNTVLDTEETDNTEESYDDDMDIPF